MSYATVCMHIRVYVDHMYVSYLCVDVGASYVCIHVCMCIGMYACMYVPYALYVLTYVCMYVYM